MFLSKKFSPKCAFKTLTRPLKPIVRAFERKSICYWRKSKIVVVLGISKFGRIAYDVRCCYLKRNMRHYLKREKEGKKNNFSAECLRGV